MKPTPEQQAILDSALAPQSLMINALAGCAKTTTLEMLSTRLPGGLALAFNKKIKDELARRFPKNFTVLTLNGLGHRAWAKAIGKSPSIDDKKIAKLINSLPAKLNQDQWGDVKRLVTAAMHAGLVHEKYPNKGLLPDCPESWEDIAEDLWIKPTGLTIASARQVLSQSTAQAFQGVISFDDQIYMSTMFNGIYWPRYPLVMVDEAQDLSPLNHLQLKKISSNRLIVVGDPKQAIYAFRGADSSSMEKIRTLRPDWLDLPLATTFRCPRIIVERQLWHAPNFQAWPSNPEGEFYEYDGKWHLPPGPVAILCRNNAPLLSMAFKLIRNGIGCFMLGRDIGKGLLALSKRILPDDSLTKTQCHALIIGWMESETEIAIANDKPEKIQRIEDQGESLLAVLEHARDAGELRKAITDLFSRENGRVTLSTGHRAKGMEWPTVIHLEPDLIPSKYAKGKALEQENNLKYVIETRTKQTLILATLDNFA